MSALKYLLFFSAEGETKSWSKNRKAPLTKNVYRLTSTLHKGKRNFFFLFFAQRGVSGQAGTPDSLSSCKRLITCFLTSRGCNGVLRRLTHYPAGPCTSDQSRMYLFRRGRQNYSKTTWRKNKTITIMVRPRPGVSCCSYCFCLFVLYTWTEDVWNIKHFCHVCVCLCSRCLNVMYKPVEVTYPGTTLPVRGQGMKLQMPHRCGLLRTMNMTGISFMFPHPDIEVSWLSLLCSWAFPPILILSVQETGSLIVSTQWCDWSWWPDKGVGSFYSLFFYCLLLTQRLSAVFLGLFLFIFFQKWDFDACR